MNELFEVNESMRVVCLASECQDIIIQTQAQQLLPIVLHKLIALHKREQIEVVYVRCILKPIETFQPKPKKS